jgi:DNA repair photolyase
VDAKTIELTTIERPGDVIRAAHLGPDEVATLREAARSGGAAVTVPIPTLDARTLRAFEPGSAPPRRRLSLLRRLARAGVPAGVAIAPILPGITDRLGDLERLVGAAAAAGARWLVAETLRLPAVTRRSFFKRLARERPDLFDRYLAAYGDGSAPPRLWAERVLAMVESLRVEAGLAASPEEAAGSFGRVVQPRLPFGPGSRARAG